MKTYKIKHLPTNSTLGSVEATSFSVEENGIIEFYLETDTGTTKRSRLVAVTQVSSDILIFEEQTPGPVLVMPKKV